MSARISIAAAVLLLAGCNSSSRLQDRSGPSRRSGSSAGHLVEGSAGPSSFVSRSAVWSIQTAKGFGFDGKPLLVQSSDSPAICHQWTSRTTDSSTQRMTFGLVTTNVSGEAEPARTLGDYEVDTGTGSTLPPSSKLARGFYEEGCAKSAVRRIVSGTVTLTKLTNLAVEGSFNVVVSCAPCSIPDAPVSGRFAASRCDAFDANRTLTCSSNSAPQNPGAQYQ